MLEAVLTYLHHWFPVRCDAGTFTIASGIPDVDFLKPGQYYRIKGSVFSDGLHVYQSGETLADETFEGEIWALAIPKSVKELAEEYGLKKGSVYRAMKRYSPGPGKSKSCQSEE